MKARVDLTGKRFGRLLVVERLYMDSGQRLYRCQCDCGNSHVARSGNLKAGRTSNCGCARYKHNGRTQSNGKRARLYYIWETMVRRCTVPGASGYFRYGRRGIGVCDDWRDFGTFYDWAISHGYRSDLTIERIDNDGDYEPNNCRWASQREQARNTRTNCNVTFRGKTQCLMAWSEWSGIPYGTLHARLIRYGWPTERALTEPVRSKRAPKTPPGAHVRAHTGDRGRT